MECLEFLQDAAQGDVTVRIESQAGSKQIHGIDEDVLAEHAPALFNKMKTADEQKLVEFIDQESQAAVISTLRFLYLGDYRLSEQLLDCACSILFHLQMVKVAQLYDIGLLEQQARRYLLYELEYSCSTSRAAIDISDAIRFLYIELPEESDLKETIAHYCLENLIYHGLATSEEFRQTIYEAPAFHRLLLKINIDQGFEAEGASEIIAMKTCPHVAHTSCNKEVERSASFLCRIHTEELGKPVEDEATSSWGEPSRSNSFTLVERPRIHAEQAQWWVAGDLTWRDTVDDPRFIPLATTEPPNTHRHNKFAAMHELDRSGQQDDLYQHDDPEMSDLCDESGANEQPDTEAVDGHPILDSPTLEALSTDSPLLFSGEGSDSDWSLVDDILESENQGRVSAAVDPSRQWPLMVQNQSPTEEKTDEEWDLGDTEDIKPTG